MVIGWFKPEMVVRTARLGSIIDGCGDCASTFLVTGSVPINENPIARAKTIIKLTSVTVCNAGFVETPPLFIVPPFLLCDHICRDRARESRAVFSEADVEVRRVAVCRQTNPGYERQAAGEHAPVTADWNYELGVVD